VAGALVRRPDRDDSFEEVGRAGGVEAARGEGTQGDAVAPEAVIDDAVVAPGHDGQAVLVVRIRHENGVVDSVTLDAACARKLMEDCGAESAGALRGHPWHRLLAVLEQT